MLQSREEPAQAAGESASARPSGADRPARTPQWMREQKRAITRVDELCAALDLTEEELRGARRAEAEGLPLRITPYYLSLCDRRDPRCPVRLQCVPRAEESLEVPGDLADPLGETAHEVAPHLVQRYPDRALLLATDRCAVYCRFCTRSRMVGDGGGAVSMEALAPAFRYLESHPEVRDIILSGGDPLTLSTPRLVRVVERLRAISSVETIRLATRVPVTLPSRITAELVRALRPHHPLWVMTHFNHPKELTREAERACRRLVDSGFPVNNQTVLLRGVNDSAEVLSELFRGLVRWRVRPYYLLQADVVRGTSHLRTPVSRGVEIMEQLQGRLSGIALPKLIVDTPNGMGKVPIGPDYVVRREPGRTVLRTHRGVSVEVLDPPDSASPPGRAGDAAREPARPARRRLEIVGGSA
ncbi:MAG: KamA family radical SAM protein [Polyangiaceae bacterium]